MCGRISVVINLIFNSVQHISRWVAKIIRMWTGIFNEFFIIIFQSESKLPGAHFLPKSSLLLRCYDVEEINWWLILDCKWKAKQDQTVVHFPWERVCAPEHIGIALPKYIWIRIFKGFSFVTFWYGNNIFHRNPKKVYYRGLDMKFNCALATHLAVHNWIIDRLLF